MKKGTKLVVYDLNSSVVDSFVAQGASKAARPADVAKEARVIITMLPSSPHVKGVYNGEEGLLKAVAKNSLLIDCSTIDPGSARELAQVRGTTQHCLLTLLFDCWLRMLTEMLLFCVGWGCRLPRRRTWWLLMLLCPVELAELRQAR